MLNDNEEEDPREAQLRVKLEAGQRKNARLAGLTGMGLQDNEIADLEGAEMQEDPLMQSQRRIEDREDSYNKGRLRRGRLLSPERTDAFQQPPALIRKQPLKTDE